MDRRTFIATGAVAAIAPTLAGAQETGPEATSIADQAKRYLDIMRGPQDDDAAYAALSRILAIQFPRQALPRARSQIRGLEVHGPIRAGETTADFDAFDTDNQIWARATLSFESDPRHRITNLRLVAAPPPSDAPPTPRLQGAALGDAIRQRAESLLAQDRFAGAVLVARGGRLETQGAWGLADRNRKLPNNLETQFRFGSMGKMFTIVSVMRLVQDGKIELKAPLGTYLKDYPNAEIAHGVTLEHLLTHTGGTGDIFSPEATARRDELRDPKDYVAFYGARAPLFPAGSRQQYSNFGFMLLGRIVEAASGQTYDDYIAQHIFAPAAMTATGNWPESTIVARRAVGYTGEPGHRVSNSDTLPYRGTPAGGGYSTVGDMRRFADALTGRRLLDEARLKLLTEGNLTTPDGRSFPYDFRGKTPEGRIFWGHNGGAPGMSGALRILPDSGHVVTVLANIDPPSADGMTKFIIDRLA
jgi:CubicO group peptidase (beta-lactamase class C family)